MSTLSLGEGGYIGNIGPTRAQVSKRRAEWLQLDFFTAAPRPVAWWGNDPEGFLLVPSRAANDTSYRSLDGQEEMC